jgi:hypothetical protein
MTKKIISVIAIAIIVSSLFLLSNIQPAQAYLHSSVSSGQIYSAATNELIGKYGCSIGYDGSGGNTNDRFYYPSIEVKGINAYEVTSIVITVSGTKPNGQPIDGDSEFNDLGHKVSPRDTGNDWSETLEFIYNTISYIDPTGLTGALEIGTDAQGGLFDGWSVSTHQNSNSVWADWHMGGICLDPYGYLERGLQFKFSLHCDPSLGGTYTLNVHYSVVQQVGTYASTITHTDIYQTVTYEYTPTHVTSIFSYGMLSQPSYTYSEECLEGYTPDDNFAIIACAGGGAAYITGELNEIKSGQTDIYLNCVSWGSGAYIYVYTSETGGTGSWQYLSEHWIDPAYPNSLYYIGATQENVGYVLICMLNNFSYDPAYLGIDCVIAV